MVGPCVGRVLTASGGGQSGGRGRRRAGALAAVTVAVAGRRATRCRPRNGRCQAVSRLSLTENENEGLINGQSDHNYTSI